MRFLFLGLAISLLAAFSGCTSGKSSDTARTAKEQLLISNSVDQALNKVDFTAFYGSAVYFDEKYLECVDKNYIVGSIRHRILRGGAQLVDKREDADVVIEARSGGVGTNNSQTFIGVPEIAMPGPLPLTIPEIKLITKQNQTGTAKIGLVAYDAKTKTLLGDGGVTLAQSDDNNWFFLGMGPYQNGSIRNEVSTGLQAQPANQPVPNFVAFENPQNPAAPDSIQWASGENSGEQ